MLPEKPEKHPRQFAFNWRISVFAAVFFPLFVWLAIWQFHRGEEKAVLIKAMEERATGKSISIYDIATVDFKKQGETWQGMPLSVQGHYDEDVILLLDNRVLNGKVGFEVLQLFVPTGEARWMLVNRGFVAMGKTRKDKITLAPLKVKNKVLGLIDIPSPDTFILDSALETIAEDIVIQSVDINQISETLDRPMYPFVLRLAATEADALPRHWPVSVMQPAKHYGYTLQWSLMAVALLGLYLWVSFPRREDMPGIEPGSAPGTPPENGDRDNE
ncbi:MAG: SURF1 family protein [Gammaproteobacteria bacterium]|nr:SURF1 family protein [Gammaproteobacteria bacterium]